MLNENYELQKWLQSVPKFNNQTSEIELTQSYQQWLRTRFPNVMVSETQTGSSLYPAKVVCMLY